MKKIILIVLAVLIPFIVLTIGFNTQELYGAKDAEGFMSAYQVIYNLLLLILGIGIPAITIGYLIENWKKL